MIQFRLLAVEDGILFGEVARHIASVVEEGRLVHAEGKKDFITNQIFPRSAAQDLGHVTSQHVHDVVVNRLRPKVVGWL